MIVREPQLDERPAQGYLGLRSQTPMSGLGDAIRHGVDSVFGYLNEQGIPPMGAPFIRYHVINMAGQMEIEIGVPVEGGHAGSDEIRPGTLPAGRYASLIYRGVANGMPANAALLAWAAQQGLALDQHTVPAGDAFAGRYEAMLTGPEDDPDPANWDSEVAIKLKDEGKGP